jgi:asparagine synthase (glutamine-hydrolysing)
MRTATQHYTSNGPPPLYRWPVLHIRFTEGERVTVEGPTHAIFGNSHRASPSVIVPTDPYAEWFWDGTRLRAQTDRYGFFPLFYQIDPNGIRISPSIVALLETGASTALNDAALAVLLRTGFFVGDDTAFRNIHLMPPHGLLIWEPGRIKVSGTIVKGERQLYTRASAIDAFIERFREAIRRRPGNGFVVVPLSGGRDSRHIFLELYEQGRKPNVAVTIGPPPSYNTDDVVTAHKIAEAAGVPHLTFESPNPQWPAESKTRLDTHFETTDHWWLQSLVSYLATLQAEHSSITVYEGVAGDVLSTFVRKTSDIQRQYEEGAFDPIAESLLGDEGYLPKMLPPELYRRFSRESAHDRLVQELARHVDQSHPLASFLVYNRTRRVTSIPPASLLSPFATVWCPYLDADVFDFLMSLSPDILTGATIQEFHDQTIQKAYPKFANIPFADKYGLRKQVVPRYQLRLLGDMARHLLQQRPRMVKPTFFYPRLLRAALDPSYWWEVFIISSRSNYLFELSRYAT